METGAVIMLVFGLTLLYGGLTAFIGIALRSKNR